MPTVASHAPTPFSSHVAADSPEAPTGGMACSDPVSSIAAALSWSPFHTAPQNVCSSSLLAVAACQHAAERAHVAPPERLPQRCLGERLARAFLRGFGLCHGCCVGHGLRFGRSFFCGRGLRHSFGLCCVGHGLRFGRGFCGFGFASLAAMSTRCCWLKSLCKQL
eukprot:TRINITY_DN4952_c0_g1_i3.p2 TRINITY_DN4952_c0_g1~~TRINITY_DN4952_c0_g1_i3.p2  ORF type:complete len:165 (+),score=25.29 TRINITY_DN4952_c0_g1_i3:71-565(+)